MFSCLNPKAEVKILKAQERGFRTMNRLGTGARQAARLALQWLTSLNNHVEVSITSGIYKDKKAILIAEYKNISLIEFYKNQTRIYIENFRIVKLGKSKTR